MNQNDNKLAGRKCRDNIPQLEPKLVCHICKNRKQKGFPGMLLLCCNKIIDVQNSIDAVDLKM